MTNENKNKQGQGQERSAERNKGQQGEKMTNRYGTKNPKPEEQEEEDMLELGEPIDSEEASQDPAPAQQPTRKPGA